LSSLVFGRSFIAILTISIVFVGAEETPDIHIEAPASPEPPAVSDKPSNKPSKQ